MKKQTFEQALEELRLTVEKLESGSTTLEESVRLYEKGTKLSLFCAKCLEEARQKITQLEETSDEQPAD